MKKVVIFLLCMMILLTGCGQTQSQNDTGNESDTSNESIDSITELNLSNEVVPEFDSLDDDQLLCYVEDTVYTELVETLDPDNFYVEGVETAYVSKEYLDEVESNSQSNIFFGYSLADLDEQFLGKKYIFTLDENGQTCVQELEEIDDTYDEVLKNVAIGSGVILISVTVAIVTKNPAATAKTSTLLGKTAKIIFTLSSNAAKGGTAMALQSAGIGGAAATITEAIKTGDVEKALKAGLVGASEGFKIGAIIGTITGIVDGITTIDNRRYFPIGSEQASKYTEGVEFTIGEDGSLYPRFEKWAKATAKFDTPSLETANNHTTLCGIYYWDEKIANLQCGFSQTPAGYVWHHVEDMKTMILVPQDLHSIAMGGMSHTGGASLIKKFLEGLS
jgi:hypothetical protein